MKKFEIIKNTVQVPFSERNRIYTGFSTNYTDFPELETVETFDTLEDARKALEKYRTTINKSSGNAGSFYEVTEFFIMENNYNEEGEYLDGGDVWDFSRMSIDVVNENDCSVETFDNMIDALECLDGKENIDDYYINL